MIRMKITAVSIMIFSLIFCFSCPSLMAKEEPSHDIDGFLVQADRVIGENMTVDFIKGQSAQKKEMTMLSIHYDKATILGMKLTKEFSTPEGPMSITMEAKGPVTIHNMTVDASALSFKGACIEPSALIPSAGLEDVAMTAHNLSSSDSDLEGLVLQTVRGFQSPKKPSELSILKDAALLPLNQLEKELGNLKDGKLPLICGDGQTKEAAAKKEEPSAGKQIDDALGKLTQPVKPAGDLVKKTVETADSVTKPIKDTVKPILKPIEGTVSKVAKPLKDSTKIVDDTVKSADHTLTSVCQKTSDAKGKITKELGLELVDQALQKKKPLSAICEGDSSISEQLLKMQNTLLGDLGIGSLLGVEGEQKKFDEKELKKLRETLLKEKDGSIIGQ
ncbi:hypothetical protein [Falsibacillus pallidus]|uniref:hypothetical protein n=1 Tax=Falsibacillus pallidus TaxID=493781 RepID=UPI003D9897D1